jgi:competence protein ComEC
MRRGRSSRFLTFVSLLVLVAAAVYWFGIAGRAPSEPPASTGQLLLSVLDVGQADSIFVRTAAGRTMLVDSGNEAADAQRVILPYLKKQGVSSLDYLVLTHPDQDHVGGMPAVLDGIAVSAFVDSVQPGEINQTYLRVLQQVQSKAIKAIKARRGNASIDLGAGTEVQLLGPEDPLLKGDSPTNNNGVVLRLTYGAVSALLPADIGQITEERLLAHRDNLRSQILKVAHHGSQSSSTTQFLDAVQPEVALISVGAGNSYGHPSRETLQRMEKRSTKVYRTDLNGTIEVAVDGRGYRVATEKTGD